MNVAHVSTKDVKIDFLVKDDMTHIFEENPDISLEDLELKYRTIKERRLAMTEARLSKEIGDADEIRLERYDSMNWHRGDALLIKMGSWPKMKELDITLTTGNIVETWENVKQIRDDEHYDDYSEFEIQKGAFQRLITKIKGIQHYAGFINEKMPLILFPRGTVRENDYNTWAKRHDEIPCNIFDYDIDAGNGAALSFAGLGWERANSYVGRAK